MSEEKKLGEGIPFQHDHIQETAKTFENIRNEWREIHYKTHDSE